MDRHQETRPVKAISRVRFLNVPVRPLLQSVVIEPEAIPLPRKWLPMRIIQAIILLAFLGAIGIFAVQNVQTVSLRFLNWSTSGPVALLIVGVYFLGMLTGWTVVSFLRRSIRKVSEHRQD